MKGLAFPDGNIAKMIQHSCFQKGLILELCGPSDEVIKFMPPLNIDKPILLEGLDIFEESVKECTSKIKTAEENIAL